MNFFSRLSHLVMLGGPLLILLPCSAVSDSWIPERRRPQFQTEPGHAVFPYVFDMPGIGSGYGVLGAMNNIAGSYTDIAGTFFEGEVQGQAFGLNSLHIIPERLIFDCGGAHIDHVTVQSYSERGMETAKDDYSEVELEDTVGIATRLTATFMDRRLEAFIAYYGNQGRFVALRDKDGNLITAADDATSDWFGTQVIGGRIDLTDDYMDPRSGIRFEQSLWWTPPSGSAANYFFVDNNITGYIPFGKRNVWAFNYLLSTACVIDQGETDMQALAAEEGLSEDDLADARVQEYLDNLVAENRFGSATSLGGVNRLRSYPESRYRGAQSQFVGTEFRWNLTDEVKPFDLFLIKDIRTSVQIAPFYEIGTVTEHADDAWSIVRSSYGVGIRVLTASGLIYRLDLATGDEGFQPSLFFQYPWEL